MQETGKIVGFSVVPAHSTPVGTHPQRTGAVFEHHPDDIETQTPIIVMVVPVDLALVAIIARHTPVRTKPHKTLAILEHTAYSGMRQAIFQGEMGKL